MFSNILSRFLRIRLNLKKTLIPEWPKNYFFTKFEYGYQNNPEFYIDSKLIAYQNNPEFYIDSKLIAKYKNLLTQKL